MAWPAHAPPHDTLPWLHSMLHVNISNWSNSRKLNASDSVITGRVMPVKRAVTYSISYMHYTHPLGIRQPFAPKFYSLQSPYKRFSNTTQYKYDQTTNTYQNKVNKYEISTHV